MRSRRRGVILQAFGQKYKVALADAAKMVGKYILAVTPEAFHALDEDLHEPLDQLQKHDIIGLARDSNIDVLVRLAKSEEARQLFGCFVAKKTAMEARSAMLQRFCVEGDHKVKETENQTKAATICSIFHAVQALRKKLKPEQTRGELCLQTRKTCGSLPSSLMDLLEAEIKADSKSASKALSVHTALTVAPPAARRAPA